MRASLDHFQAPDMFLWFLGGLCFPHTFIHTSMSKLYLLRDHCLLPASGQEWQGILQFKHGSKCKCDCVQWHLVVECSGGGEGNSPVNSTADSYFSHSDKTIYLGASGKMTKRERDKKNKQ